MNPREDPKRCPDPCGLFDPIRHILSMNSRVHPRYKALDNAVDVAGEGSGVDRKGRLQNLVVLEAD